MQQLIINRKQFLPQAQHGAKDWGPVTTRRHKWVTGCSVHTHIHTDAWKTASPVSISQSFLLFFSCLPLFFTALHLFNNFTAMVRSVHTTHPAHECVFSVPTLSRGQRNSLQPSFLCFKVISDLSMWDSTPQAAPEGNWAKQWPFHGEYDSYISSFVRHACSELHLVSCSVCPYHCHCITLEPQSLFILLGTKGHKHLL